MYKKHLQYIIFMKTITKYLFLVKKQYKYSVLIFVFVHVLFYKEQVS